MAIALVLSAGAFAAAPEQFSTSKGALQITPIQHASLMLQAGGKVMYIDPAQGNYDGRPRADYILITDIHGDHMAPAVVDKLKTPSTVILAPAAVCATIKSASAISRWKPSPCTI
jgi:L-ascorbate metabolism protein UlaG (beta-lactamase superfamily)